MVRQVDNNSSVNVFSENTRLLRPLSESLRSESSSLEEPSRPESPEDILARTRRILYISHLFNQFSEVAWQFCLVLFLAAFSNYESLILVSSYGLVSASCVCYFGSAAGRFIDGSNRLLVARRFIGFENCAVLLATLFCYLMLVSQADESSSSRTKDSSLSTGRFAGVPTDLRSILLLIAIHLLGATAQILDTGFLVAIERDWVVVMSQCVKAAGLSEAEQLKEQKSWLSDTNVAMKQIDLSCKVVAPAISGYIVGLLDDGTSRQHGFDLRGAALFVGCINVIALVVEYVCVAKIYREVPGLALKSPTYPPILISAGSDQTADSEKRSRAWFEKVPRGLKVYFDQPIAWAGIGLSLLYLNVMTFGGIMTAYLVWRGMRLEAIGVLRGVSSAAGLAGTFVYHFLSTRMTLIDIGMCSVTFQFLCLSLSYVSFFIDAYYTSLVMLITGVCASRVGLWVFDISVAQTMQLHIPEDVRGLVGGVQQSINAFFGLLSFALGIVIPDPKYFHIYASAGYAGVGLALLCFAFGVFARKRRLLSVQDGI